MGYPERINTPVEVYAGDTVAFFESITFTEGGSPLDLPTEGWSSWQAMWRPTTRSPRVVELDVDTSNAAVGVVRVSADASATRMMQNILNAAGGGMTGVWDLQALNDSVPRTWVTGSTTHSEDVTR